MGRNATLAVRPEPARTYMGCHLHRQRADMAGCRWWAFVDGRQVKADTLTGLRSLIRYYRQS